MRLLVFVLLFGFTSAYTMDSFRHSAVSITHRRGEITASTTYGGTFSYRGQDRWETIHTRVTKNVRTGSVTVRAYVEYMERIDVDINKGVKKALLAAIGKHEAACDSDGESSYSAGASEEY